VRAAISPDLRFEVKELGEIDMALVAAIDTELLEPPDAGTESWLQQPPRQSDLPRILASWQERDLVPRDVAPEFAARLLRVWRASQDAVRDWRPSPYTGRSMCSACRRPRPCRRPLSSEHTSAVRTSAWLAHSESCSADQR
jgi:hypothetical protein